MIRFLSLILAGLSMPALLFSQSVTSPDGNLKLTFSLGQGGVPHYSLSFHEKPVLLASRLGLTTLSKPGLESGFSLLSAENSEKDETWTPVWGEVSSIRNHYRELAVTLTQPGAKNRNLTIRFRLFNDGLGFRYEFPRQPELSYFNVVSELTEFNLTGDHLAWWMPGDYDSNEYLYTTSRLSEINAFEVFASKEKGEKTQAGEYVVQTPLMLKTDGGLYLNIHEAALVDYPAMNLNVDRKNRSLSAHLVPGPGGVQAHLQTPAKTPWRTVILAEKATGILDSKLVLNLNEPSVIGDVSWIKPMKYIGIWWEMHVGKSSWNYSDTGNLKLAETDWSKLTPNGRHGATTERTKFYIDFAAEHHIPAVLVEGWNVGWEDWWGNWKEEVFDFVTPYPDFDVAGLQAYAASKGVKLIMHHETSASVTNYERRFDRAAGFMKQYGYDAVKTGYVGRIIPRGEHHDGQWMVNHYVRVARGFADRKILLDAHEPVRPTGLHRTYPNWLACEAARGNEFNGWSYGNTPEHETILPFTRLVGGPMDYTPGIFQVKMDYYQPGKKEAVKTTLVKQLALYVTLYSPFQMAADLPENYNRFPDAFKFIEQVATDWDDTRYLDAEPGDFILAARKEKGTGTWFAGAITDENARTLTLDLSFLTPGEQYQAELYLDGKEASWDKNPMVYEIKKQVVTSEMKLTLPLAAGGGAALVLRPAN